MHWISVCVRKVVGYGRCGGVHRRVMFDGDTSMHLSMHGRMHGRMHQTTPFDRSRQCTLVLVWPPMRCLFLSPSRLLRFPSIHLNRRLAHAPPYPTAWARTRRRGAQQQPPPPQGQEQEQEPRADGCRHCRGASPGGFCELTGWCKCEWPGLVWRGRLPRLIRTLPSPFYLG